MPGTEHWGEVRNCHSRQRLCRAHVPPPPLPFLHTGSLGAFTSELITTNSLKLLPWRGGLFLSSLNPVWPNELFCPTKCGRCSAIHLPSRGLKRSSGLCFHTFAALRQSCEEAWATRGREQVSRDKIISSGSLYLADCSQPDKWLQLPEWPKERTTERPSWT